MKTEQPELGATVRESATRWTQLDAELRILCWGLAAPSGWSPEAVTTFVRLPGDAEYAQAVGTLCRRLAGEYGLEGGVLRQGEDWRVRFSRPSAVPVAAVTHQALPLPNPTHRLRAFVARIRVAMRRHPAVA